MALDFLNPEALRDLGQTVRQQRERLGLTQPSLAQKAGYTDRIIRIIEHGGRTKLQTLQDVCEALGLSSDLYEVKQHILSDEKYGSYNLSHYADYIGLYFGFRHGLTPKNDFLRTVYEIKWSQTKRCLEFSETQEYIDKTIGRKQNYSQNGDIYISNRTGMLHLLTSVKGSIRLITLCRMRQDDQLLEGVVLTQIEGSHYYSPGVSPFFLKKIDGTNEKGELLDKIGNVLPEDDEYAEVSNYLQKIQREVARFAPNFFLDPKVTRLSSRTRQRV